MELLEKTLKNALEFTRYIYFTAFFREDEANEGAMRQCLFN